MGSLSGYLRVAEDGAWWEEAAAHWLVATITVTDTRIKERLLETKRLELTEEAEAPGGREERVKRTKDSLSVPESQRKDLGRSGRAGKRDRLKRGGWFRESLPFFSGPTPPISVQAGSFLLDWAIVAAGMFLF